MIKPAPEFTELVLFNYRDMINRRNFIKTTAITGVGVAAGSSLFASVSGPAKGRRVGIIGLDTSHSVAFIKTLNAPDADAGYLGYKVVAAYPKGSLDIKTSYERIPKYTEQAKEMGVEIMDSVDSLISKVDVVLLETNDGRRHLEQALPVLKAGKRLFIDKPMAASLSDAMIIFDAAKHYNVPVFSASSLRYVTGIDKVVDGAYGKVTGADTYSPMKLEETHPDLFWYGIHGVETLFTAMGTGCEMVTRISTPDTDVVNGIWNDQRVGTFRGIRSGEKGYGGTAFTEKKIVNLGPYGGYNPLLKEIVKYFDTGKIPVQPEETLEILAFMDAADISKKKGGKPALIKESMEKARKKADKFSF